jgi:hypothetical protein
MDRIGHSPSELSRRDVKSGALEFVPRQRWNRRDGLCNACGLLHKAIAKSVALKYEAG